MSASFLSETDSPPLQIVDLSQVASDRLKPLWEQERSLWRVELGWDVTPALDAVRSAAARGGLPGKVVLTAGKVAGYGYYLVEGRRIVIGGLVVSHGADPLATGPPLVRALSRAAKTDFDVDRVETQFVDFGASWLEPAFRREGFRPYRRVFLRRHIVYAPSRPMGSSDMSVEVWRPSHLLESAGLMHRAHAGRVDAEMNELYRSREGCRLLLENILHQNGCGRPLDEASFLVRKGSAAPAGFVLVTEISSGQAHVAQIAVAPEDEGKGLGRLLLSRSFLELAERGYRTVSLMVSEENRRALQLYESFGFRALLRFPVFSWDRPGVAPAR